MRVVFLEDVPGVAEGGDVKEVKNGFARNYLIPKHLAVAATHDTLQRVERLTQQAEVTRLETLADMQRLGEELDGFHVNIEMRAGASGRLYGSVTNVIVAASLAAATGRDIDRRTIEISDSIRQVGVHEARIRLHAEVQVGLVLVVHGPGMDPADVLQQAQSEEAAESTEVEEAPAEAQDDGAAEAAHAAPQEPLAEEPAEAQAVVAEEPAKEQIVVAEEPAEEQVVAAEEPAEAQAVVAEEPAKEQAVVAEEPAKAQAVVAEEPAEEQIVVAEEPAEEQIVVAEEPAEEQVVVAEEPAEEQVVVAEEPAEEQVVVAEVEAPETAADESPAADEEQPEMEQQDSVEDQKASEPDEDEAKPQE